jgi:hypothetical protein
MKAKNLLGELDDHVNATQVETSKSSDAIDDTKQSLLEERHSQGSSLSSNSNVSDILENNTRLIFKYPDGSYAYAFKCQKTN